MKKTILLACLLGCLTVPNAMADAVALQGQEYGNQSGAGYFPNVQFKSNADADWTPDKLWDELDTWPGYDPNSPNLLDDANDFSISLEIEKDFFFENSYDEYPFVSSGGGGHGLLVELYSSGNGNPLQWTIAQMDNGSIIGERSFGVDFDGKAGTYVFRSGENFMDLWRVINGKAELLVTHNEPLVGSLYGYLYSSAYSESSGIMFGIEEEFNYLTYNQITNATLYNGLYTADGVGSLSPDVDVVPEPTTATLSLLALAGLAAHRRRK